MTPLVRYGYVLALMVALNATSREEGDGRVVWWIIALAVAALAYALDRIGDHPQSKP